MSAFLYMIAGEPSGDALGGRLMGALKKADADIVFGGIGGETMTEQGLHSIVPMEDLCVMGIAEIVKEYPRLRRLAYDIIADIEKKQPDCVITIDLPDFNFAVAKRLKKRGLYKGKIIHYVAPSVWAWRPGRAKKIAAFLDGLLCLFPFEPPYFERHGLRSEFVGHAMVESDILKGDGVKFRNAHGIDANQKTLGVFFGSRRKEVETHADIFIAAIKDMDVHVIVPTMPRFEAVLRDKLQQTDLSYTITTDSSKKWNAFAACDRALAVSGTVGLELAYAGVPHVIAYKTSALTAFIARRLIQTPYVHLPNILLQKSAVPELLQENCTPEKIAQALLHLSNQNDDLAHIRSLLTLDKAPSNQAAQFICSNIQSVI